MDPQNNPQQCSCGKYYPAGEGVDFCQANRHGSGKDGYGDRLKFNSGLELEIFCECAECDERLTASMAQSGNVLTLSVARHLCQCDGPD